MKQKVNIFEATMDNFQEQVLNSALPVLVEFGADWCPPCRMLEPIVAEVARDYEGQMRVASLNVDENPDLQIEYGVMGVPTLILFQNGEPVKRIVGFVPRQKIEAGVTPFLNVEA